MKFSRKKSKGHASLWWDYVQEERSKKGKEKITSWDIMVAKLKGKFLPSDYGIQLYRKLQNLKQKDMDVNTYIEELYKLSIRLSHMEEDVDKVARYLNEMKYSLQDELSLTSPRTVEECYQLAMKAEDKLRRRQKKQRRGRGSTFRGRGSFSDLGKSHES